MANCAACLLLQERILDEVRALRIELAARERHGKTPRQARAERRRKRFIEIAEASGLGRTFAAAAAVVTMLSNARPAPAGQEANVLALQRDDECPRSLEHIWRLIRPTDEDY